MRVEVIDCGNVRIVHDKKAGARGREQGQTSVDTYLLSAAVVLNKGLKVTPGRQSPTEAKSGQVRVEVSLRKINVATNEVSGEGESIADAIATAEIESPDRPPIETSRCDVPTGKETGAGI